MKQQASNNSSKAGEARETAANDKSTKVAEDNENLTGTADQEEEGDTGEHAELIWGCPGLWGSDEDQIQFMKKEVSSLGIKPAAAATGKLRRKRTSNASIIGSMRMAIMIAKAYQSYEEVPCGEVAPDIIGACFVEESDLVSRYMNELAR